MGSFFIIMEIWKSVKDYEGIYEVSDLGNVRSLKFGKKKLLSFGTGKGYYNVSLYLNGVRKCVDVHKLVAIAFLNHKPNGFVLVVDHKDFNRKNNNKDNLEIITTRKNTNKKHIKSSSEYVGVCWNKRAKKWKSSIRINKKRYHLGYFTNELEAYNKYLFALNNLIL